LQTKSARGDGNVARAADLWFTDALLFFFLYLLLFIPGVISAITYPIAEMF
jgi:uncharacterized membrane protein YqaE (UPF0057 family)